MQKSAHRMEMFFKSVTLLAGLVAGFSAVALAQTPGQANNPSFGPVKVTPLTSSIYFVQGGAGGNNGNAGFIVGDRGVIVIDAKLNAVGARLMLDEIAKITPKPVTHVLITHSHGDHTGGLAAFPSGVTIIGHENARREIEEAVAAGGQFAPPAAAIPTRVVRGSGERLKIQGVRFALIHTKPAHTTGDLAIYLPDQKILFTGDLMATTRREPLIGRGATVAGYIDFCKTIVALKAKTIVTGHGELVTNADLERRMNETADKLEKVKTLVATGKSLDEIKQALGDPVTVAAPGGAAQIPPLSEVIYRELKQ